MSIYDQHQAAFANVSAFVLLVDGERIGTVALKFPRDGAGRLTAYVHVLGLPMVRGFASGFGYDKRSAAVEDAVKRIVFDDTGRSEDANKFAALIQRTLAPDSGDDWNRRLEKAGFTVLQAV